MIDLGLKGRSVLVTGGSKGIGRSIAEAFARAGCRVCLVARSQSELDAAARDLEAMGGQKVGTVALDLREPGAVENVAQQHPDLDILVNNAGDIPAGTLEEVTESAWRSAWDLKVFGYINLSRVYFSRMKNSDGGVILNVIGAAGEQLDAEYIAGSVGNAALMAFTRALGSTSLDYGIRVVGLNPGPVHTERLRSILRRIALRRLGDERRWNEIEQKFPLGRAARPEEIAQAAVWLASPLSAYISGTILTLDGGLTNRRPIS